MRLLSPPLHLPGARIVSGHKMDKGTLREHRARTAARYGLLWSEVRRLGVCHWTARVSRGAELLASAESLTRRGARKNARRLRLAIQALDDGREQQEQENTGEREGEVLVEGSFFKREDLPTVLGNVMRRADEYGREAKRLHQEKQELVRALRLTHEYVGLDTLPAVPGWDWYDALSRHAPEYVASLPREQQT